MSRIKILPVDVRNKIAAGEVVERPASVVKELLENSIDAGSTDIKVEVLQGGKRLIRVSDDGCGMDKEDALLCLERHATSKLSTEEDLFDIKTLGFRGEALPSIASVSRTRLITGPAGSAEGICIEVRGGEIIEKRDAPSVGTSIEIRDLFFNTPARRKFLKADNTELLHIVDIFTKEALSHFGIRFSLFSENRESMLLPGASGYRERIMQSYGEEFTKGLLEVDVGRGGIGLSAYFSNSGNFRNGKAHQHLFINDRPVRDQTVAHAVYRAYEGILPGDRHPVFFIFLRMDPRQVDFNVHPTKREVRFADKEAVYRLVYGSLREAVKGERADLSGRFNEPPDVAASGRSPGYQMQSHFSGPAVSEPSELSYRPQLPYIYLGETFIAVSGKGGLTLIDHHAAHERILYEKLLRRVDLQSCRLLFPEQVKLSHKEYLTILQNKELLQEFGIEIDDFGHDTVVVRSLPDVLTKAYLRGILADAASEIMEDVHPGKSLKEAVAARVACHGSVRGKDVLNAEEVSKLLADLEAADNPDQCPHGRPTRLFYSLDSLWKMFKRK